MNFSDKQKKFLFADLKKFNIVWGTTGSGKTFICNIRFIYEFHKSPKGSLLMLSGNTSESLYDNVIKPVLQMDNDLEYKNIRGHNRLISKVNGNECVCVGANNAEAEAKIQGKNVYMWYADEVAKQPMSFVNMAILRLRYVDKGKLQSRPCIWTLNPDMPAHDIKVKYIDCLNAIGGSEWIFDFADNPTIENVEEHKKELEKITHGSIRDRLVYNKWAANENSAFPEWDSTRERELVIQWEQPKYLRRVCSLDPGVVDNTGYLIGYYDFSKDKYIIENEMMCNNKNTDEIYKLIIETEKNTFEGLPYIRVSDTSLQMILDLNQLYKLNIVPTKKDDKTAQINYIRTLINQNKLIINPRCSNLIRQIKTCCWNKNRNDFMRNDLDAHFDLIDAMIYLIRNFNKENPYPDIRSTMNQNDSMYIGDRNKKSILEKIFISED